jgi:hypothetical protein
MAENEQMHKITNTRDIKKSISYKECLLPTTKYLLILTLIESSSINEPWEGKSWALKFLLSIREVCTA